MKKWVVLLIAIGIVATVVIFAPIIPKNFRGSEKVDFSVDIDQINLVVTSTSVNIHVSYAANPTADLITATWDMTYWSSLIATRAVGVTFTNNTIGNILTVTVTVSVKGFSLSTVTIDNTLYITINPSIITNLNAGAISGNINLLTNNYLNKTLVDLKLATDSGNVNVDLINESNIQGNLHLRTNSGNCGVNIAENSYIGGTLQANTSSGNNEVRLLENVTLNNDFMILCSSGNVNADFYNISLNNNEINGLIKTISGNVNVDFYQWLDPSGNLTLSCIATSGNIPLTLRLAEPYISSQISYAAISGNIVLNPSPPGFNQPGASLMTSSAPPRSSNIDIALTTSSGNINIHAIRA